LFFCWTGIFQNGASGAYFAKSHKMNVQTEKSLLAFSHIEKIIFVTGNLVRQ
jgi:hypothetical protein